MPTACIQKLCLQTRSQRYSHAPQKQLWLPKRWQGWSRNTVGTVPAQVCESWPIKAGRVGLRGGVLRQGVNRCAAVMGNMRKIMCFLNIKECKHLLDDNQSKISNFKIGIIWDQWNKNNFRDVFTYMHNLSFGNKLRLTSWQLVAYFACSELFSKGFESLCVLFRWNGGTRSPVADRYLPQREEWGDVQSAGYRQHGWSLLHAGHGHGAVPHYLRLWASLLLEAQILLHRGLHGQAGSSFLHQSGEDQFMCLTCLSGCAGVFYKHSLACFVIWENTAMLQICAEWIFKDTLWNNSLKFGPIDSSQNQATECVHMWVCGCADVWAWGGPTGFKWSCPRL